jgi:ADP-heptose:LPS heptosyltransferase
VSLRGSSLRSSLLLRGCRGALRAGWSGVANRFLLDVTAPRRRDTYYPLVFGRLLTALGGAVDPAATMAAIAEAHADDAVPAGARRLICLPAGKVAAKQWGVDNYLTLGARLAQQVPGLRPLAVLGPGELDFAPRFAAAGWELRTGEAAGPRRLAGLCRGAACIVGNDCGPGHIAQMSGAPTVVLFPNHHGQRRRAELLKLWWWRRAHSRAITTVAERPLAEVPPELVADEALAAMGDSSARSEALWWDG